MQKQANVTAKIELEKIEAGVPTRWYDFLLPSRVRKLMLDGTAYRIEQAGNKVEKVDYKNNKIKIWQQ